MKQQMMKRSCAVALTMIGLAGCQNEAARLEPVAVVLKAEKGEAATLQIPRGYIEQPKKPEGELPNVLLRVPAKDFSGAEAFVAESEVRVLIEPRAGNADAAKELLAAALRRPKAAEEAIVKSTEGPKSKLDVYTYRNGKENAEAYYLTSPSGDVFVECWKSVCKAYKTWKKRVHLRFDYQPAQTAEVPAVDTAIDAMLQTFAPDTK